MSIDERGESPNSKSGPGTRMRLGLSDLFARQDAVVPRNYTAAVLSELRAFQARRQADSEAGPGLGDQLRHQG